MAISNAYPTGIPVADADLFVGTKAYTNRTVNYTAQGIADYLNINAKVSIGGQMSFRFSITPDISKTISFEGGLGNNTPFADITRLVTSGSDASGSDITIFLNYLIDTQILLAEQNQPNNFGHYKITGYSQIGITDFYNLDLEYIGGNGNIVDDTYYDLVSFNLSGGAGTTPTLAEVLTVGGREIKDASGTTYEFITSDKSKYLIFQGFEEQIISEPNSTYFSAGDVLTGVSGIDGFNLIIDNTSGFINPSLTTSFILNYLDEFQLTCLDPSAWILTITRYNSTATTPTLQEVTTAGNETTDNIIKRIGDWTLQITDDGGGAPGSAPLITMNHDVYGPKGIYAPQGLQLNSVDELAVLSQMEILAERNNYIGFQVQNEDLVNVGNNLFTTLKFPTTSSIDQINISREFTFPDKPTGTYILATTDDIGDFVPYTGATADVNLGEFGLLPGNLQFDTTPTNIPTTAGSLVWNDSDGTLDLTLKGGNVTLQIGQESVLRVVNKTATNVNLLEANYQAVRVTGAQGQRLKVDLAQATTDAFSAETIGLVTETINNNQEGFITTGGLVRGINTTGSLQSETWADGDILYLSPTIAGNVTKVKPAAPNHLVIIGYVVHAHVNQGSIFVKVDNGYELDELHNVKIVTPTDGQALTYTSATDIWENKTLTKSSVGLGNVDNTSDANKPVSTATQTALDLRTRELLQNFTDYTTTGVLTEQIISNQAISANDMKINSWLNFISTFSRTGTTQATIAIYLNTTSNSLVGAVKIGTATITSTQSLPCFKRDFSINASSVLRGLNFTANAPTDEIGTNTQSTTTLTLGSAYYLISTATLNNVADTVTQRAINLKSSR